MLLLSGVTKSEDITSTAVSQGTTLNNGSSQKDSATDGEILLFFLVNTMGDFKRCII